MVALAIIGVLMAVAVPAFQSWLLNSQIYSAAESVQMGLQRARTEAVMRNKTVEFTLTPGTTTWEVGIPGNPPFEQSKDKGRLKSVKQTVLPDGSTKVAFDLMGRVLATASDGSPSITSIAFDSTVLQPAESKDLKVTVAASGKTKMCDPNAATTSTRACN